MESIGEVCRTAAERAAQRAEAVRNTAPEERLARGVERYGWAPDATCSWCGDRGISPVSGRYCDCDAGRQQREDDQRQEQLREWDRLWAATNVPARFRRYRLDSSPCSPAVVEQVRGWLALQRREPGLNLIVTGSVGTGKTGLAVGALWELQAALVRPLCFASLARLIDSTRPNAADEGLFAAAQRAAVLALDDLGTIKQTEWAMDRLFALINARYEDHRATIVTTNLAIPELADTLGERLVSRLLEQTAVVAVDGPDRRLVTAG